MTQSILATRSSRRDFLKTSAAAAATVAGLGIARTAHAAGSDIIKVGLIGCGDRGAGAALNAMNADPGVRIVAMADLFADRIETKRTLLREKKPNQMTVTDDHCFTGFDGYKEVIAICDVVLIACASKFHSKYLMEAISAGKHVFVEKPHAIDPPGVRLVTAACELAKQKKLSIVSGLMNRYSTPVRETINRVRDGAIGEIIAVESNYLRGPYRLIERKPGLTETEYQFSNWYHFSWLSGDDVIQSLVHNLDKATWAMGERVPLTAHGLGGRSASFGEVNGDVFDHHSVVYEYSNGVKLYAHCRTQVGCHHEVSDILHGSKGRCHIMQHRITGETNWRFQSDKGNPYQNEMNALFHAVRSGTPINNGDYMARSTLVAIIGQLACYSGKKVTWDEVTVSNFNFGPQDGTFATEPPVRPGLNGDYPVAVPGKFPLV